MYELITKQGDVIIKRHAESMDDAITIFSIIKDLSKESLLDVFDVKCTK